MKKSELRQLIREEIRKVISEKKSIQELDKATYDRAAAQAGERGYGALSKKFKQHGKEFGTLSKNATMDLISQSGDEGTQTYKIYDVQWYPQSNKARLTVTNDRYDEPYPDVTVLTYLNDPDPLTRKKIKVLTTYGGITLAKTLADAVKFIKMLKQNGVEGDFDPKLFTYGKVSFEDIDKI